MMLGQDHSAVGACTPPVNWTSTGNTLTVATTSAAASSRALRATGGATSGVTLEAEATAARLGWALLDAEETPRQGVPQPRKTAAPARGESR
jgi:hypothetical protein